MTRQLPGVRWSHEHHRYCIPMTQRNLDCLTAHFRDVATVNISGLQKGMISEPRSENVVLHQRGSNPHQSNAKATRSSEVITTGDAKPQILQVNLDKVRELGCVMEERRYSKSTIDTYLSMLKQFFAHHSNKCWNELNKDDVVTFNHAVFIQRNRSFSTQNQAINAIKLFYMVHGGLIMPEKIERPRKSTRLPEVLTKEEFKSIFAKLRNTKHRALIGLIYGCGLRIGEAINLELKDIRPESNMLYVRQSKGRKDRPVPLSAGVYAVLDHYIKLYAPHVYVFEGVNGGKYSYSSSRQLFKRAVRSSGLRRHITLHTLRHSYATHLLQSGTDIRYIQEILGHNDPKTTMIYTRVTMRDLRDIKSPFDDMDL
jgi:site-specific recombinase XerD